MTWKVVCPDCERSWTVGTERGGEAIQRMHKSIQGHATYLRSKAVQTEKPVEPKKLPCPVNCVCGNDQLEEDVKTMQEWERNKGMNEGKPIFVTLEGIDGSGKTTLSDALKAHYGSDMKRTKEPSLKWTGDVVREALQDRETPALTDFFLFMADRNYHIANVINPALAEGKVVVSDRYSDSTRAYQSYTLREAFKDPMNFIDRTMSGWNRKPDLTIWLDIDAEEGLRRAGGTDKYETADMLDHAQGVYEGLYRDDKEGRWYRIDANLPPEKILQLAVTKIEEVRNGL